jgi:hypothetical protein
MKRGKMEGDRSKGTRVGEDCSPWQDGPVEVGFGGRTA